MSIGQKRQNLKKQENGKIAENKNFVNLSRQYNETMKMGKTWKI